MLLLNVPDAGEQALMSGFMFDGIATKEASEVEQPMFQELGIMEAMQKKESQPPSTGTGMPSRFIKLLFKAIVKGQD